MHKYDFGLDTVKLTLEPCERTPQLYLLYNNFFIVSMIFSFTLKLICSNADARENQAVLVDLYYVDLY